MLNMNYEVYCGSASVELTQYSTTTTLDYWNIYHDSFGVTHVLSQVYYSSFLKKMITTMKIFIVVFLILYYNKAGVDYSWNVNFF